MVRHRAGRHPGPMMIRVLTFVSLFLCLGWTASVRAADPPALQLDGDRGIFWVHAAPAAMAFREAGCCIDLDRALALDAWAPVAGDMIPTAALPVPGTDAGPVWVRFDVQNVMTRDGRWLIDTRAMRFRQISVTLLRDTGTAEVLLDLDRASDFADRPIRHRHVMTDLDLGAGERAAVVVRYLPLMSEPVDLRIASLDPLWFAEAVSFAWVGIFYSGIASSVAIALLAMPFLGRRLTAAYVGFLGLGLVWILADMGMLHRLGLVSDPVLELRLAHVFLQLTLAGGLVAALCMFRRGPWHAPTRAVTGALLVLATLGLVLPALETVRLVSAAGFVLAMAASLGLGLGVVRARQVGGRPVLLATVICAVGVPAIYLGVGSGVTQFDVHELNRAFLALFTLVYMVAMISRALDIRRARDAAVQAELASAGEKLRLSRELRDRERAYEHFRREAERRQAHVETLGHDLAQPLAALRRAFARDDASRQADLREALDYLESVATGLMDDAPAPDADQREVFPAATVLDNVHAMFEDEVRAKGLDMRYTRSEVPLEGDPILLIRALSNLMVNALRHTSTGAIHLFARVRSDGRIAIGVADTGSGMTEDEARHYLQRGARHATSPGRGVGLSSVAEAAEAMNARLDLATEPGRGTTISLVFCAADAD